MVQRKHFFYYMCYGDTFESGCMQENTTTDVGVSISDSHSYGIMSHCIVCYVPS